ncbi:MAG: hypothetical protein ACRDRI_16005 [Pseudonocardiaceae bacterium]
MSDLLANPPLPDSPSGQPFHRSVGGRVARAVAAVGLAYDAYSHLDLAAGFDANTAAISQGMLFRVNAVLACLAALGVLLIRRRAAALFAVLVAATTLSAVLLYRYIDLGALGPLPDMYEPSWYPEKTLSAIAEAGAVIAAGALLLVGRLKVSALTRPDSG